MVHSVIPCHLCTCASLSPRLTLAPFHLLQTAINAIIKAVGAQMDSQSGIASVNCRNINNLPIIYFYLAGAKLGLTPKQYILQATDNGNTVCFLGMNALDIKTPEGPMW